MPTTGYLRERNGRYYAILNLYDSTGKRIQKSHPTGLVVKNNKRKAEQILKQLCVEYDNKNLMFYSNIKVADYFEKWLLSIKEEVRPNTFRSSTTTLKFYAHIDKTSKMAIAEKLAAS